MQMTRRLFCYIILSVMKMILGIEDENFLRADKIPMTKREIRILTLATARIEDEKVVVDIGAGTGSLTVEAAKLAPNAKIFAIEKNLDAVNILNKNLEKFSVDNVTVINDDASTALKNIDSIDVAVIGGSSGKLEKILDILDEKLVTGGRIVANFIAIQSLSTCLEWLKRHKNFHYDAIQVQINRLQKIGAYDMAKALNPIYILTAEKL